jgi:hypothetical protein
VQAVIGGLVFACTSLALANGDFCSSAAFKDAFLEGQGAVDFPTVGPKLLKFGNAAVPCLAAIARGDRDALKLSNCGTNPRKCQSWAVLSLTAIGTSKAKEVLLSLLRQKSDPIELSQVIGGLDSLRVLEARPEIRELLKHESPYVRARAVLALGSLGDGRDVDAMMAATLRLPRNNLNDAIRGLEFTGDPRVIGTLEQLGRKFTDPVVHDEIVRTIDRIKAGKALRPTVKNGG